MKKITFEDYKNKVLGGWVGKCAGGILGAPIEGFKNFNKIPFTDDLFATNFANDDLDLQVLWLDMILKKGADVREQDFNEHWQNHVEFPWCEYGIAMRNIRLGLDNPSTGKHNNWYWDTGMGSPIRSEIWGMVTPGHPKLAAFYAGIDSRLDHAGFSVTAEQYLSACASIAFFETDIKEVLVKGLAYIPADSDVAQLVNQVFEWDRDYDFKIVAAKIKSVYGDADFTSAPMNIGFTILSLLHTEHSFDFLIDALHLGHDSDCVVATAGALLGIVLGYDGIPQLWKDRVGDELLVSPEIVNIYCPDTLTELAELTCKAGLSFVDTENGIEITDCPNELKTDFPKKLYALNVETLILPNPVTKTKGHAVIHYENLTKQDQQIRLSIDSDYLKGQKIDLAVKAKSKVSEKVEIDLKKVNFDNSKVTIPYKITVNLNDHTESYKKGFPFYGSWLLMGPFIEDDESLVPFHPKYPDHGLDSLPSVKYMNQDKKCAEKEFISIPEIKTLIKDKSIFAQPYQTKIISPNEMKMDLKEHFHGIGERALYLYTEVTSSTDVKKWLALGAAGYLTVWFNNKQVYKNDQLVRSYPIAHSVELDFKKGTNSILIRLDAFLDDFKIEVGLKEFNNKHPHQEQWDTELQFNCIDSLS
ncbi:ADP-ribosylglycohydrolase family protein [Galbibacter sp. BG1]|uniref:ADP-ribosylglycohydrolase family protein n=1 Tax=Galbibacter sp. BG1 TaxID=1170699 RepID=UPI0015C05985|nr:ADP-ribosylglycohydrolase family protein [Galbibacter sp. BG1]QLE02199.1 ADP-ribosylglycohydrolase family protein [Galbibacter sp. BG1]